MFVFIFISLQDEFTVEIIFYMKGVDVVMFIIVQYNDWLEEEVMSCLIVVQKCFYEMQ